MRISFMLVSNAGELQEEKSNLISVHVSIDGAPFETVNIPVHETGNGFYYVDLSDNDLRCSYNVLIRITATGCQDSVFEYTPDEKVLGIAKEVWEYGNRTLTSLTTGSQKASQFLSSSIKPKPSQTTKQGLTVKQVLGGK